jgi:hypothetical protein
MKMRTFVFPFLLFFTCLTHAQVKPSSTNLNEKQNSTYKLVKTENMWTFLKLNTRNGKISQVQYSLKEDNAFEYDLNEVALVEQKEEFNNRFTLYPTENIFNFLLLDTNNGKVWQVQWSIEPAKRFIIRIPNLSSNLE